MNEELLEDGYTTVEFPRIGKIRRFRLYWRNGRKEGYPICCILRFAIDNMFRDGKSYSLLEYEREAIEKDGRTFIPCGVFHRHER